MIFSGGDAPPSETHMSIWQAISEYDGHISRRSLLLGALMTTAAPFTTSVLAQERGGRLAAPAASASGLESARPLTEQGLRNLTAFTRLLGYVRHFHPSDQAAAADWDMLAVEGMRRIEPCEGTEQLAEALEAFFRPLAPTVQVFGSGVQPETPSDLVQPVGVADLKVTWWHHRGAGQVAVPIRGAPSLYRSERVSTSVSGGKFDTDAPEPEQIFTADLGGGLIARVPLKIYADATGTLPHSPLPVSTEKPELSGNGRATRLAAVALAWNVFQHFYPYFDVVETDWPRALTTALTSAATDADERAFVTTLRRLVAALKDGHGAVVHPKVIDRSGTLPLAWAWAEGKVVISHVLAEAAAAGLAPGDIVLAIDGEPIEDAVARARELIGSATPQDTRHSLLNHFRRGPVGSIVRLRIANPKGAQRTVVLSRSAQAEVVAEPRPAKVAELEPGIAYFDIDRTTEADLEAALPQLAAAKAVIFDLRGYPGLFGFLAHLSAERLESAIWQIPVVTRPDRVGPAEYATSRWDVEPKAPLIKGRMIFLTDGSAISAAETVMGIVEAYRLAHIVGEATAGTNGNVNPFTVPGGYMLSWTGMHVLKHDGTRHHGVGIRPTHPVSRTIAGIAERRDEVLEKALELARQPRPS
jgi:C-terminal processing protease CtpA/Prc